MHPIELRSRSVRPFAAAVLALTLSAAAYGQDTVRLDVPYVPTPDFVVARMIELAQVGKDDYVIDLGSGDGRIAIAAAKKGARALGVDINPERIREANANAAKAGVTDRVTFRQENLFETRISDANVITMYLLPRVNLDLRPRLLDELRPGTRIVSHAFDMGDWLADHHERLENRDVYLWIIPAKVDGRWEVSEGDRRFTILLNQQFQQVKGTATIDGRTIPLTGVGLKGDQIQFTVEASPGKREQFKGKASGETLSGDAGGRSWQAKRLGRGS
jgi:precorrin-6B methylase 2